MNPGPIPAVTEARRAARGGRLELSKLTKRHANFLAVDALDLSVASGEFLTLLGPSGSGKTTTLMMVAGFTTPTSGDILLDGASIASLAPERRNIGVVFQNYALFPHMSVRDNIAFPLKMRRQPRAVIEDKVRVAMQLVRLEGLGERLPRQLSGGQQQRVAIARALVFDPSLLLMDEPLGALDKNLRGQMQFELKRLHHDLGVTVVYVTHDQEEALTMSDRVALMNKGVIEQLGSARALYEEPVNRFVAEFIGESNLIEGRLLEHGCFMTDGGVRFPVASDGPLRAGDPGLLVARPEKFSLTPQGSSDPGIAGRISEHVYVGDFTRFRVAIPGGVSVMVKVQNNRSAAPGGPGDEVRIFLNPGDARVLLNNPNPGAGDEKT
ncbi:MAG TPA: ABC transporter ATP-binding protein [Burkholderiaceae bacterium]